MENSQILKDTPGSEGGRKGTNSRIYQLFSRKSRKKRLGDNGDITRKDHKNSPEKRRKNSKFADGPLVENLVIVVDNYEFFTVSTGLSTALKSLGIFFKVDIIRCVLREI